MSLRFKSNGLFFSSLLAFAALGSLSTAAEAQTYEYAVDRLMPCTNACSGDISVQGTVTVDALGELAASNFVDWSITTSSTNYPATVQDPTNSSILNIFDGPTGPVSATACEMTISIPGPNDDDFAIFAIRDSLAFPYIVLWQFQGGDGSGAQEIFSNAPRTAFTQPFDQGVRNFDPSQPAVVTLMSTDPACSDPCADPSTATILGTAGDDYILGTPGDDIIFGLDGNDLIDAGGGNDIICGGTGIDNILGRDGDDYIDGGPGFNFLKGYEGDDTIVGGDDGNEIQGWLGNDTLTGGAGPDTIYGGVGDDMISGGGGNDYLSGMTGNDTISGGDGDDRLVGDSGDDCLDGGAGADQLNGDAGNDCLDGGADGDVLVCSAGSDGFSTDASDLTPGADCEAAAVCTCG